MIKLKRNILLNNYTDNVITMYSSFYRDSDEGRKDFHFSGVDGNRFWTQKDILAYAKAGDETFEQVIPYFAQISEVDPTNNIALYVKLSDIIGIDMERIG